MQSSLLAVITPREMRHTAFAQQRVAANLGLGIGGFVGGVIVTTARPSTFTMLFALNTAALLFVARIRVPRPPREAAVAPGYRGVLRDGAFMRLVALNFAIVVGAISLLNSVFPVYAKNNAGVSETVIGALLLLNCLTIVVLQLPIAAAVEGRRRMRAFSIMGGLVAVCWLQVSGGVVTSGGVVVLLLASGIFTMSLAECLYDSVYGPLTADLAPPGLLGR